MKNRRVLLVLCKLSVIIVFLFSSTGCPEPTVKLEVVESGFNTPTALTHPGDGTGRLFVADQTGEIYVIEEGTKLQQPFLSVSNRMVSLLSAYDERGLLGLAFHPEYAENGRFFVHYSAPEPGQGVDHKSVVSEFLVSSENVNLADDTSERIILTVSQPESNHNAGQLAFGPDGYLYIGLGDGGGSYDRHGTIGNAQDTSTLLGSILRIDVDTGDPYGIPSGNPFVADTEARDEIYAYGFRNPYRFSFDNDTGRLIVGDVGQWNWEELNLVEKGGNYGWRIMEGNHIYDQDLADDLGIDPESLQKPIDEYDHSVGHAVVAGFVYRGGQPCEILGKYVFADWGKSFLIPSGHLYYLEETEPDVWTRVELLMDPFVRYILAIGEDQDGELYVLSKTTLGPVGETGDVRHLVFQ